MLNWSEASCRSQNNWEMYGASNVNVKSSLDCGPPKGKDSESSAEKWRPVSRELGMTAMNFSESR